MSRLHTSIEPRGRCLERRIEPLALRLGKAVTEGDAGRSARSSDLTKQIERSVNLIVGLAVMRE